MSQLKHRIAIGKIIDGEWKHERYATPEEMAELKPKADGSGVVEYTRGFKNETETIPDGVEIISNRWDEYFYWQDVSDTHRIELGMETYDKHGDPLDIYDGDIFVDWNTGIPDKCSKPVVFELFVHHDFVHPESFPMVEILGNIHENPELMEVT